jgi:alpha-tubulin suppressor-like RCC1 family protein
MPDVDGKYICVCVDGFEWDGENKVCNENPDPCLVHPCLSKQNTECIPEKTTGSDYFTGSWVCSCVDGWAYSEKSSDCIPSFKSVSAGKDHVCAIDYYDNLYCWGSNFNGQLGINGVSSGSGSGVQVPTKVNGEAWKGVDAGEAHACGATFDNKLYCWGYNYFGQIGNNKSGENQQEIMPILIFSDNEGLFSAGRNHTCTIKSNKLYCWGHNSNGQVGAGSGDNVISSPINISSTVDWKMVSAGAQHTCGINNSSKLYCWGLNLEGELGDGTNVYKNAPVQIGTDQWNYISAGWGYTCGIKVGGSLFCWGANGEGQLGDNGSNSSSTVPVQVDSTMVTSWKKVSAGTMHTCAISLNDELYCWGRNNYGQIAVESVLSFNSPQMVSADKWIDVSAGDGFSCGVQMNGGMYCWGLNEFGQIGINSIGGTYKIIEPVRSKSTL